MAEPAKQQIGDGADNYGQAASQMAKSARQAGQEAVKQTAAKGAEQAANAAAATVKASVEGGKAAAEIAAGTAAGGPWGAALSAAWSLRHTLFKILICICLSLLFLIVLVASLPSIVCNSVFGLDGSKPAEGVTPAMVYTELANAVSDVVDDGYSRAMAQVDKLISDGGFDHDASMNALINHAQSPAGYDVSYILAAYSASMQQKNAKKDDMIAKLNKISESMFPVTSEEKQKEIISPITYYTYKPVTLTVVTKKVKTGTVNGVTQYRYETAEQTYYLPDETHISEETVEVDRYQSVEITLPIYADGVITGTKKETYYEANGKETLSPTKKTVRLVECTIHPFDNAVIAKAFGLDLNASYDPFGIPTAEAIQNMATALKMTLYGAAGSGQPVPWTDVKLSAFVNRQNCSEMRKHILTTALSLVGKVPYFWGGKSLAGWNEEWNTPKLVTAAGSAASGTIRPYGLDCSGFTDWTFQTAAGVSLSEGTWNQWDNSFAVSESDLLPGDLGFLKDSDGQGWSHVLIFAGYGEDGKRMWVHSSSGEGVILNSPGYEETLELRRPKNVHFDAIS